MDIWGFAQQPLISRKARLPIAVSHSRMRFFFFFCQREVVFWFFFFFFFVPYHFDFYFILFYFCFFLSLSHRFLFWHDLIRFSASFAVPFFLTVFFFHFHFYFFFFSFFPHTFSTVVLTHSQDQNPNPPIELDLTNDVAIELLLSDCQHVINTNALPRPSCLV
ncbi:uncharacterized protein BDW43DRAFT_172598 [Aspergillus alliaceus]|uniref:uncharacterized protein n=1 Tax=Petromyces alliaceus TaxID=209559 RepID=UPI0012A5493A|nr:uncharacterized protein BDW43DRAFT_172598 [Aspergillus alliaceus]KAB8230104.1 hypothetical protein BDW43DRAFT_172598 [Aspergillus alliaceus]